MTRFVKVMRDREKAEEDLYFQRLDRELIEALHRKAKAVGGKRGGLADPGFQESPAREVFTK